MGDLTDTLSALPGAEHVKVLSGAGVINITHDGCLDIDVVRRAAEQHNITLVADDESTGDGERRSWRDRFGLNIVFVTVLLVATLVSGHIADSNTLAKIFGLATIAVGGAHYVRDAWAALRARRLGFVHLLVVAVIGGVVLGVIEETALLVVIFLVGEVLEGWIADRANRSLRLLMDLMPASAHRLLGDGEQETVLVRDLGVGDRLLVRAGERLPIDGLVISGSSAIDQSAVTGESIPVEVTSGDEVFGGTVNGNGALVLKVARTYEETTLAWIIRQVEEAQARKGSAQRFADRYGPRYTYAVVAIALTAAIAGPLLGGSLREWAYRALVVFIVSPSCALAISVPTAIAAAVTRGAREGILIRGGAFLEALAAVRTVVFDKTGTLTVGRPQLTDVLSLNGVSEHDVLALAASVEAVSEHPLAGAVLAGARERGLTWQAADDVETQPGIGVSADAGGHRLFVGRPDAFNGHFDAVDALRAEGKTVVAVARDDLPIGLLAVIDELRTSTHRTVTDLHALGVDRVVMLTGDHERVTRAVALAAGVDEWRAGLLPEDKSETIAELRQESGPVAMVGDGINDAPALALADVGIAMGASGTTVALETADVALMANELEKLPDAVYLARRAMRIVRQNIVLALLTVVVLVSAALAGRLALAEGLLLNEVAAILIIANGLRLLRPIKLTASGAQGEDHKQSTTPSIVARHPEGAAR